MEKNLQRLQLAYSVEKRDVRLFGDDFRGQIERGYHAGGLSYGYRSVVAGINARGEPIGHRLEVDEPQAVVVREIFERYAQDESCQRIAATLNARGVPGPRGGTWCVSALYGPRRKVPGC